MGLLLIADARHQAFKIAEFEYKPQNYIERKTNLNRKGTWAMSHDNDINNNAVAFPDSVEL